MTLIKRIVTDLFCIFFCNNNGLITLLVLKLLEIKNRIFNNAGALVLNPLKDKKAIVGTFGSGRLKVN